MLLIVHYLSLLALLASVGWLVSAPDWEPAIALMGALAVFLGSEVESARRSKPQTAAATHVETYAQIHTAFARFSNMVADGRLPVAKAEFIQHSSERASNFILALARAGADVELFLQEPDTALRLSPPLFEAGIRRRIDGYEQPLNRITYRKEFKLYLYKTPASVNAVRLRASNNEVILILGWYAYYHMGAPASLNQSQVGGGENPCIVINSAHRDFRHFEEFFEDLLTTYKSQTAAPVRHMSAGRRII